MQCPYCKKEMTAGILYGDTYRMKWLPRKRGLFLGIWAFGGCGVGRGGFFTRAIVRAHFCDSCKKLVIDEHPREVKL